MEIGIVILLAIILLINLGMFNHILTSDNRQHIIIQNQDNDKKELIHEFQIGSKHTWALVNIALYKMYTELEILDYDSLQIKLAKTIDDLSTNQTKLSEWRNKLDEYVQDQQNGRTDQ